MTRLKPKELDLSDIQQKAYDIIIQMINDKDSKLLVDNVNSRKGIENKDVFVKIEKNRLSIINGVYFYNVAIDDRIHDNITEKFNDKLNRKFNAIDKKIGLNI